MHIKIITVGKLKEKYWESAEAEYLKRLSPYAKITFVELAEESFKPSDPTEMIQKKEAEKIIKTLEDDSFVIVLHERGKEKTSVEFANFLEQKTSGGTHLTFIVGGPTGLHESILKKADLQLSLSKLTFPHQMVRTILLEQLYRAVTIMKGKVYHY